MMTVQLLRATKEIYHIRHLFAHRSEIQTFDREGQKPGGGGPRHLRGVRGCTSAPLWTVDGLRWPFLSIVLCICI
jgi:hypothetical protein